MPVVANYESFRDVSFPLRIGGDIGRTLESKIVNTPVSGENVILMWKHGRTSTGSVTYRVEVNGEEVTTSTISQTIPEGDYSSLHEVLQTNQIQQGDNTVRFQVTGGTGTVRISDVVILYRLNV